MSVSGLIRSISDSRDTIRNKMIAAGQATTNDLLEDLAANLEIGTGRLPEYEGSYTVTPRVTDQVLETQNTSLLEDITVLKIPYSSATNPSGGTTVTIG